MGGVVKEGVEGHIRMSLQHLEPDAFRCNGAQLANTAQHRRNPLQTTGKRGGRYMKGRGMKRKNMRMINRQERNEEVGNSEAEDRKRENKSSELKGRLRE